MKKLSEIKSPLSRYSKISMFFWNVYCFVLSEVRSARSHGSAAASYEISRLTRL